MRAPLRSLAAAACLCLAASACSRRSPEAPGLRARVDGLGRTVHVPPPERVKRVVSLAPSTTEVLFAIGAGGLVVGVDRYSDFPPEARALPQVGADVDPSLERILALHPDLVLTATSANTPATVEALERLSIPVFVSRSESLEEIFRGVLDLGDLVGRRPDAEALAARMRARIAAVGRPDGSAPQKALMVVWPEPLIVAGRATHVGDLLRAAGAENIADESPLAWPTFSLERVLARAPSVVIVGTHKDGVPSLASLEAVAKAPDGSRRFRIELIDGDLIFRPGPRVADGVELLAKILRGR